MQTGLWNISVPDKPPDGLEFLAREFTEEEKRRLEEEIKRDAKEAEKCRKNGHDAPNGEVLWRGMKVLNVSGDNVIAEKDFLYSCMKCDDTYKLKDIPYKHRILDF